MNTKRRNHLDLPLPLSLALLAALAPNLVGCIDDLSDDEGSLDMMRAGELIYDAVAEFDDPNPNDVWSYGYGSVGGDFIPAPDFTTNGAFALRGGGGGADGWRGLHKNLSAQVQQQEGVVFEPSALVMHPGNSVDSLTKIRFEAPVSGCFDVDVTWTNIDEQATSTYAWIYTNAASEQGAVYPVTPPGFKEILSQPLEGYEASVSFSRVVVLDAGEVLSFELGNGGDGYFNDSVNIELALTEVSCEPSGSVNLALGKPTSQSSTYVDGGESARAVDGDRGGDWSLGSVTHTNNNPDEWWQVDLLESQNIGQVVLYNRTDCCADRLSDFQVRVSNDGVNWGDIHVPGSAGEATLVPVNRDARYVRVQKHGYLSLAEVEIYAAPTIPDLSYPRGVGTIPEFSCGPGEQNDSGLCYPLCDPAFEGVGPVCWEECGSGYTDGGALCTNWSTLHSYWKDSYGRGVGTIPTPNCDQGEENDAGLCYDECDVGYDGVGPVCWFDDIDIEMIAEEVCSGLRSSAIASIVEDLDSALIAGVGLGAAAGVSTALEVGVAYGANGEFGCYVSSCFGVAPALEISGYSVMGIYDQFTSIAGESTITSAGVSIGIPDTPVSFGGDMGLVSNSDNEEIGMTLNVNVGIGFSTPIALGAQSCYTEMLQTL